MSNSGIFDHLREIKLRDLPRNVASQCAKRKWPLACAFFYLILALVLTWPVVSSPFSKVPIGSEPTASVPLYNIWATWWNADRLAGGLFGYWDAPIFFPTKGSFCLSEPQPTTMMVAPVIWITGSRILAYNIYIWISLVLNGLFAQRLAQTFGMGRWTALWAGTAMVLLPIVHWQLGISQLAPLWAILWTLTAIEQLCRTPTKRNGVTLGIAASLAFVTCMHHGLFLAILLIGAAPTLWRHWIRPKEIKCWGVALAVALIFTVPFVSQVKSVTELHAIEWEKNLITNNSAKVTDYLHAPSDPYLCISFDAGKQNPLFLSPGALKYLLAIVGIVFGLRNPQFRRWASFLLAIAVLAFFLSLGPNLRLGDFQPWWWLSEHLPGFDRVRSVMRFAFFVQISVIIFAALGINGLYRWSRDRFTKPESQAASRLAVAAIAFTTLANGYPKKGGEADITDVNQHQKWLGFVEKNTPADQGILCLPVAPGPRVWDYLGTTEFMYLGTFHKTPIFNGYSSHFPEHYVDLVSEIRFENTLTESILHKCYTGKVKHIVAKAKKGSPDRSSEFGRYWLKRVCVDELVEVYQLGRYER
ncbi:MAG: hypothetical protein P8Q54_06775 [Akkermansiaceae bacterium]|nr:hypothetical protein [Akkermansiaceae bacterium]